MSDVTSNATAIPRRTARDIARTSYIYGTLVVGLIFYIGVFGPLLLVAAYTFDRRRRCARRLARAIFPRLVQHHCRLTGTPLQIELGRVSWKELGPCIVIANHGSSLDVLLLMLLPLGIGDGRVWAKGWPFKKPLLGWLMSLSGHLLVEDFNILPDARECLADGESLLVFPESSRTRSGRLGRFRDGAFLLAARTGRPIVPVALHGTHACFPPGQPWIFWPRMRVEVLGVIQPESMEGTDKQGAAVDHAELKRQAHDMIEAALLRRATNEEATDGR